MKLQKSQKRLQKNNLEKNEEEILRVRYIPSELRHNYWWLKIKGRKLIQ